MTDSPTRDRLLVAAGELLTESPEVSTRAICERAGVQAPTLYHYFGNKQGLLAAVVETRFTEHMAAVAPDGDPVAALRESWDHHVRFGLANPNHYALTSTLMPVAENLLTGLLNEIARHGRLRTAPEVAARQLVAANVGATLSLLADDQDTAWSDQLRDTLVGAVVTDAAHAQPTGGLSAMAVGFLAALDAEPGGFTAGERTLLREWLHRAAAG
ncbi:TetR/AcrR family transcriptional regulator [Actinophytocola sp. NPDC049390]|uniref:TetR/AcrR family transcriptional regulator n=1 Tax=Actinophytocola sp. NPDC049390 TaxID=3363894 RepID=UPI00379A6BAD